MNTVEHAIALAARAHEGQLDKAGVPYIFHPIRVMLRMTTDDERIAAVLHDVVEDSGWTLDSLAAEGFNRIVIDAVDALTKRPGEDYEAFVLRASVNAIARKVKLADLADNSDPARSADHTETGRARLEKYRRAAEVLREIDRP
jgi:(p)ppGpp synthase/HD superfamily hydrolase